ncbi:putative salt-induced outer membrane protein [Pyrinomonas methylaliphatogenes]|uniref:Putative salt-induced outer membrane protein n=2 Tax=Pyrinomonas methylaliphatogenes TaxID=454194 RepID=A0A0B6X1N7_9BACT|nr:putative salt-induced outer membrane protein [Pyrinomonas methylaliphatogenes]
MGRSFQRHFAFSHSPMTHRPLSLSLLILVASCITLAQSGRKIAAQQPEQRFTVCFLNNGDRITGHAISVSAEHVAIVTEYADTVILRSSSIARCETSDEGLRAQLIAAKILSPPNGKEAVKAPPKAMPTPQQAANRPNNSPRFGWKRSLAFNYTLARGNANISDLNFSGNFTRTERDNRLIFSGFLRRGVKNGADFANLFTSTIRYERNLDLNSMPLRQLSFFTETGYEHDEMRRLNHRIVWNGGLLVPIVKTEAEELGLDLGGGITHEEYMTGLKRTLGEGVFRLTSEQKVLGNARFRQQLSAFPDFAELGRYRFQVDLSLRAPLSRILSLRIGALNRFDNRPQEQNVKRNDFSLMSGLAVEF